MDKAEVGVAGGGGGGGDQELLAGYPVLRYFAWEHLRREDMRAVSRRFCELAWEMARGLPGGAETSVTLRKLLEAKDAAVRSQLGQPSTGTG